MTTQLGARWLRMQKRIASASGIGQRRTQQKPRQDCLLLFVHTEENYREWEITLLKHYRAMTRLDLQYCPCRSESAGRSERRENITDWVLKEFQAHYRDKKISKWDIFH